MKKSLIIFTFLVIISSTIYAGLVPHKHAIQDAILQYTHSIAPIIPIFNIEPIEIEKPVMEEDIEVPVTHILTSRPGGATKWYCKAEFSSQINNEVKALDSLWIDYEDCMDDKTPDDVKKYMACINNKECQHDNDCQEDCINKYRSDISGFKSQDAQKECLEDYDFFNEVKSFYQRWNNYCYVSY